MRHHAAALLVLALALVAGEAAAHKPSRVTSRELVRVVGHFADAPVGEEKAQPIAITVQGRERAFQASEWRVFALVSEETTAEPPPAPAKLTLQGARDVLARLAGARAEQRVVLLGERRPGGAELFVLAADLCPSR
ncbi:MAG TPA: hypothetical protein VIS07_00230 [Candidatus Binatia bacterium]